MSRVLYYLILLPLSILPSFLLYWISDLISWILNNLIKYRKEVVLINLKNSFPQKSDQELNNICKAFYKHLSDLIVEMLKNFSISPPQVLKRFRLINAEVLDPYYEEGRSVILAGGHYNNWEMLAMAFDFQIDHQGMGIYFPLKNKYLNKKFKTSRERFGLELVPTKQVSSYFKESIEPFAALFAADQNPSSQSNLHWIDFLNQETAVVTGPERLAKLHNLPVFFGAIHKVKRGHYEFEMKLITDCPSDLKEGEITRMYSQMLEEQIKEKPEYWLWTHKRWKRKRQ